MNQRFQAYDAALAMVAALRPVLEPLAKGDRALADQVRRAASSVALNLAEGNRRTGQDRLQFFRIAAGSAAEVRAALEVSQPDVVINCAAYNLVDVAEDVHAARRPAGAFEPVR